MGPIAGYVLYGKIYESVGGDYGDEDNPPINYDRIEYLNKLIDFLEQSSVKTEK